jgi:voltage-gated potassium channel
MGETKVTERQNPQTTEVEHRQPPAVDNGSVDPPGKVPLTARLLLHDSLTARRAAGIIAVATVAITAGGGLLERILDHQEYPTIGRGLWFALQTVTTVGYGDVTPAQSVGRFIATVLMLTGIGFLAVVTAGVTAALVESSRRRFTAQAESDEVRRLDAIDRRLARIEAALEQQKPGRAPHGTG